MADIDRVEPHERGEQPPIRPGEGVAGEIGGLAQNPLDPVQRFEQFCHGLVIGGLGCGEAGLVDAVVDVVIDPRIDRVDLRAQSLWIVIVGIAGQLVEGRVEHADDLRTFVRDDGVALLVPQDRHGDATGIIGVDLGIDLPEQVLAEHGVAGRAFIGPETPAGFVGHLR